jgi:hypothetical protein
MVKCLSCPNESYIGETSRVIETKMKEHSNSKDSAVAGHIRETGHSFNLDNPDILCFESDYTKRKIKEALFIQEHNPSLNKQVLSYTLYLFNVPQVYSN